MVTGSLKVNRDIILAMKRQHLKERERHNPSESVLALAQMQPHPRLLLNVVTEGARPLIIGQVRRTEVYDPVSSALSMVRAGADAVGFYTDHAIYPHDYEDVFLVARALKHVPVLYQNYTFNGYGVMAARVADASAMLFYSSVLDEDALRQTVTLAQRWRMSIFVQTKTLQQVPTACDLSPHVIAYGDVTDSSLAVVLEEYPNLRALVPRHIKLMVLNCLETLDEVEAVLACGVCAIIVSHDLLRGSNAVRLRALVGKDA